MKAARLLALGAFVGLGACESTTPVVCTDTTANGSVQAVSSTRFIGQATGALLAGYVQVDITNRTENADGSETLHTTHRFGVAAGDTLFTQDVAQLSPMNAQGQATITANMNVVGGTGRFANSTGTLSANGNVDYTTTNQGQPAPTLTGSYSGEVCGA